jgi:sulfate permease, SulP family
VKWVEKYSQKLRANGNLLMLVGVESKLMTILERSGAADKIGRENIFPVQPALFGAEEAAAAAAKAWIARSDSPAGSRPGSASRS